jgi:hypothetical protein
MPPPFRCVGYSLLIVASSCKNTALQRDVTATEHCCKWMADDSGWSVCYSVVSVNAREGVQVLQLVKSHQSATMLKECKPTAAGSVCPIPPPPPKWKYEWRFHLRSYFWEKPLFPPPDNTFCLLLAGTCQSQPAKLTRISDLSDGGSLTWRTKSFIVRKETTLCKSEHNNFAVHSKTIVRSRATTLRHLTSLAALVVRPWRGR